MGLPDAGWGSLGIVFDDRCDLTFSWEGLSYPFFLDDIGALLSAKIESLLTPTWRQLCHLPQ